MKKINELLKGRYIQIVIVFFIALSLSSMPTLLSTVTLKEPSGATPINKDGANTVCEHNLGTVS